MKMKIFGNIIPAPRGRRNWRGGAMKALVAIAAVALSSTVWAEDWDEWPDGTGFTWFYCIVDSNNVRIQKDGPGSAPAITPLPTGVFQIPSTINGMPVKEIGTGAFRECVGLTKVKVPSGVTKIGGSAFLDCTSLEEVELPDSVKQISGKAFLGCTSLERVNIPSGVTTIANQTFKGCSSLEQVNIPSGVTFIPSETFEGCSSLETIKIPSSVDTIYNSAFKDCSNLNSVELNEGLTTIKAYAFYGCDSLTELMIPDSVTSIGENAFRKCSALEKVILPAKLIDSIPASAFADCPADMEIVPRYAETIGGITWSYCIEDGKAVIYKGDEVPAIPVETTGNVTVPSSLGGYPVVAIGDYAFYGCEDVKNVIIPDGVTSIGEYAFCGCDAMVSVTIPPTVASIGDRAFYDCTSLTDADIPDSVTSLGYGVFEECKGLKHVTIGRGVSEIPDQMFVNCESLTSVIVPEGVKSIGNWAFWGCKSLDSIVIPKSVTSIGTDAFAETDGLTTVYVAPGDGESVKALFKGSGRDTDGLTFVEVVTVTFNANGGACATASVLVPVGTAVGTLPDATRDGYVFDGWFTEGGVQVSADTIVAGDVTFYAHWTEIVDVAAIWYTTRAEAFAEARRTGKKVFMICGRDTCGNTMYTKNVACEDPMVKPTLVAKCVLWYTNCDTQEDENSYYWPNGSFALPVVCVIDPANEYGYIVRVTGLQWPGNIASLLTHVPDPVAPDSAIDPETIDPSNPGDLPWYKVINARDIWDPVRVSKAETLRGALYYGAEVMGIVELKLGRISKNGTSKVSGTVTTLDGKKHKIKANTLSVDSTYAGSINLEVSGLGGMDLAVGSIGGVNVFAGSLGKWHVQSANVGGNWTKANATAVVAVGDVSAFGSGVLTDLLPTNEVAAVASGKWTFKKAASVKWAKPKADQATFTPLDAKGKGLIIDTSKDKTNFSGLKLTYTPKKGTFKGSFKVYAVQAGKVKKFTINANGVVVDGVGYGTATCKRPAITWSVTVE